MRIVCIADIHGNLPALEAALSLARTLSPDLILSLGDQIGFGPQPREVLERIQAEEIPCLMGNHELRQNDYMKKRDPQLETGVNFAIVRHIQTLIDDVPFRLPVSHQIEEITFAHAAPDDPCTHLTTLSDRANALSRTKTRYLICGHQHAQLSYALDGQIMHIIGSVGMAENGIPGTVQLALVDIERGGVNVTPLLAPYDPTPVREAYLRNGFAETCPIMSRICWESILINDSLVLPFFRHLNAVKALHEDQTLTLSLWRAAADTFAWRTPGPWETFWKTSKLH